MQTIAIPLFVILLTLIVAVVFYYVYQGLQNNWNAKAEEFRDQKSDTVSLMKRLAKDHSEAAQIIEDLREQQYRLTYRLEVLHDLSEVVANCTATQLSEDQVEWVIRNFVLAATQALLPTQTDTRSRLLIFDGGKLVPYASYVPETATPFKGRTFLPGEGAVGSAFSTRQAVIISDTRKDPLFGKESNPTYRSVLCVPVPANGDNPIGVLNVDSSNVCHFSEQDAKTLAHVGNLIYVLWFLRFSLAQQRD